MGRPLVRLPTPLLLLLLLTHTLITTSALDDVLQCPMNSSKPAPDDARLVDGYLLAGNPERKYPPEAYRPDQGGGYILCTCTTGSPPCVRKCCPPNASFDDMDNCNGSLPVTSFEVPKFVNGSGTSDVHTEGQFQLVYGTQICKTGKYLMQPLEDNSDSFRVNHSGWLLDESEAIIAAPNQFCLEKFSKSNYQILPIVCSPFPPSAEPDEPVSIKITTIGMILSLPLLFTTFLVYALIKELHNLQGKSLMCNVSTLLVGYACLITVQLSIVNNDWCVIIAYTMQFSFIASFFWLNVMCFDLWWNFSGLGQLRINGVNTFINYSIYAWGCSSLISICTFSMHKLTSGAMHPGFGTYSCWFGSLGTLILYFYGPIGILLFSNMFMCVHMTLILIKQTRDAKEQIKESGNRRNLDHEKDRFIMYLKLFVVMGVTWIVEVISGTLDIEIAIVDICNSSQGVLIFIIFVCNRRVLKLLIRKLCPQTQLFNSSNIVPTSSLCETKSTFKFKEQVELISTNNT